MMRHSPQQSGIVLVMVLWVLVLIATMAAQFALSSHIEGRIATNFKENVESYYIARGAMLYAIDRLSKVHSWDSLLGTKVGEALELNWAWNRLSPPGRLPGGGYYRLQLEDEKTLIPLNNDNYYLLELLLKSVDTDPERCSMILDSLRDWRDKDKVARPHGAEESYYQQLEPPYLCKNGDLDSVKEWLLVRGMDRSILYGGERNGRRYPGIARYLTVLVPPTVGGADPTETAGIPAINVNTCRLEMLRVLPGVTPEMIKELQSQRDEQGKLTPADLSQILGADVYRRLGYLLHTAFPDTLRLTVLGLTSANAPGAAISALVRFGPTGGTGFELLEWCDEVNDSQLITTGSGLGG